MKPNRAASLGLPHGHGVGQRFGSALSLNRHSHVLALDGVYVAGADGQPEFVAAAPIHDDNERQIAETTARRVVRLCQRRGLLEEDATDALWEKEPLLATLTTAAVNGRGHRCACRATGAARGRPTRGRPRRTPVFRRRRVRCSYPHRTRG